MIKKRRKKRVVTQMLLRDPERNEISDKNLHILLNNSFMAIYNDPNASLASLFVEELIVPMVVDECFYVRWEKVFDKISVSRLDHRKKSFILGQLFNLRIKVMLYDESSITRKKNPNDSYIVAYCKKNKVNHTNVGNKLFTISDFFKVKPKRPKRPKFKGMMDEQWDLDRF